MSLRSVLVKTMLPAPIMAIFIIFAYLLFRPRLDVHLAVVLQSQYSDDFCNGGRSSCWGIAEPNTALVALW
jgi:hypothetical protein